MVSLTFLSLVIFVFVSRCARRIVLPAEWRAVCFAKRFFDPAAFQCAARMVRSRLQKELSKQAAGDAAAGDRAAADVTGNQATGDVNMAEYDFSYESSWSSELLSSVKPFLKCYLLRCICDSLEVFFLAIKSFVLHTVFMFR